MIIRVLILALLCLVPLRAYTEENGVLVLTNDDISNITEIFPHLFIKYYVPWYTCDYEGASIAKNWLLSSRKSRNNFRRGILQVHNALASPLG